jgi:hypothetical protein
MWKKHFSRYNIHSLLKETLSTPGIEKNFLNWIKAPMKTHS